MKSPMQKWIMGLTAGFGILTAACACCLQAGVPVLTLTITFGVCFYHFAMRLAVGAIVPRCIPRGAENSPWFREKPWEKELYRFLQVKYWKKHMPTYNSDTFDPKRHSWQDIVYATCTAEAVHEGIMLLSFLPVAAISLWGAPGAFWCTSFAAALLDGSFVVLQRFNRPRILGILSKEGTR